MHASIWTFTGEPDDLLHRYDSMLAETPRANTERHTRMIRSLGTRPSRGVPCRGAPRLDI